MSLDVELEIFSPRWGHSDVYNVSFERNSLTIELNMKKAKCIYVEGEDAKWEGYESINSIFTNDNIVGPSNIENLFQHVWIAWRNSDINNEDAAKELKELAKWINIITEHKPRTDFWSRYF